MRRLLPLLLVFGAATLSATTTPVITSLNPSTVIAGSGPFTLQVIGTGFLAGAFVKVNNSSRSTTFVDSQHLTVTMLGTDDINPATLQIVVVDPGNNVSSAATLTVLPNSPQISSIDPSQVGTGSSAFTLTVTGQNFGTTAVVQVNNNARTTTWISATTLTAAIPASDVSFARTLNITVLNPRSVVSNTVTLTVSGTPAPVITLLNPSTVNAGTGGFVLQILGNNFTQSATVKVNGNVRSTTFVDSGTLKAQILSNDVAQPATLSITVTTTGGTSAAATLTVVAANTPSITSISPTSVTAGGPSFTLTITGTNFMSGAVVKVNGINHNSVFVSSTTMTATISSTDIAVAGQLPITVTDPGTGTTTSNAIPLFVTDANGPQISNISPSSVLAGSSSFNLIINGSNFLDTDIAIVASSPRPATFVSATQLSTVIQAADVATAGTVDISVARSDGTMQSAPAELTVTNLGAPSITSFTPATASTTDTPFTLVITGTNFDGGAVVTFDNNPRSSQFVSSTTINVPITSGDLATQHTFSVIVTNPGGAASQPVDFAVVSPVPTISSLTPSAVISGDVGFLLHVAGSHFTSQSVINVNGSPRSTAVETSTGNLTTNIDASDIATPGNLSITVTDSGVTSAPALLAIVKSTIVSVTPNVLPFGAVSATLTVTGTGFLTTSKVLFRDIPEPTVFNSDGSLTATIGPLELIATGLAAVNVQNSPTSTSLPVFVQVFGSGAPAIDTINPSAIAAGSGDTTVVVIGSNFVPLSVVNVNGAQETTTFVSSSELTFTLSAADLASPRTLTITVVNPDATKSAGVALPVQGPPPARRRAARH